MTDRELLEAAAKAAGVEIAAGDHNWNSAGAALVVIDGQWCRWNPLADDGNALRLAVKLELQLDLRHSMHEVRIFGAPGGRTDEPAMADPYAATRRAIVRAAAALSPLVQAAACR